MLPYFIGFRPNIYIWREGLLLVGHPHCTLAGPCYFSEKIYLRTPCTFLRKLFTALHNTMVHFTTLHFTTNCNWRTC